jgi:hypothetical protein
MLLNLAFRTSARFWLLRYLRLKRLVIVVWPDRPTYNKQHGQMRHAQAKDPASWLLQQGPIAR